MVKKNSNSASDQNTALLAALLSRAGTSTKPRGVDIEPGVYQLDYTLRLTGDITVAAPTWANHDGFSDGELVAAMVLASAEGEREGLVRDAVRIIARAKKGSKNYAKQLKDMRGFVKTLATAQAEKSEIAESRERAGAIKGEPLVEVRDGTITTMPEDAAA